MIKSSLLSRFILWLPEEEYVNRNRLLYHLLQAQWYHEKFYKKQEEEEEDEKQQNKKRQRRRPIRGEAAELHKFGRWLMGRDDFPWTVTEVTDFFRNYYYQIPVCGAIIYRDASKQEWLTVKSSFAKRRGFPKGKINYQESDKDCAGREVLEETGLDIRRLIKEDQFVEYKEAKGGKRLKFFIVVLDSGTPLPLLKSEDAIEISSIEWIPVNTPASEYVRDSRHVLRLL